MADNTAARDAFRLIADTVRRVPETLGQRPTKVTLRLRTYSGAVGAQGTTLVSTVDTVLDPRPKVVDCLLYTSPSPRDGLLSRMPSSA